MSEEFWSKVIDHLIQAVVNVLLGMIAAAPVVIIAWFKMKENTRETILAKNAAIGAAKTGKENQLTLAEKKGESSTVNVENVNVEVNPDPK